MKNKNNTSKRILITLLVMVILLSMSAVLSKKISSIEEQICWDTLRDAADEIALDIVAKVSSDREMLKSIADIIAAQNSIDSPETKKIIDGFRPSSMTSYIALLLPGDKVMISEEPPIDCSGLLSFEKEAALGEHISDRSVDIKNKDHMVLRNFVPVEKNGKTIAMLYSLVDLQKFPEHMSDTIYGEQAMIYVVDGNTGDFLIDTWHDTLGHLSDLGKREVKKGYSQERMQQDALEGKEGHCIFVSKSVDDYIYFYYKPISINNWSIGISVTKDIAFVRLNTVNHILTGFIFLEIVVLSAYFIYILLSTRRELHEKQILAERDVLTGLLNRNKFECNIHQYAIDCNFSLTCAYVDVNGLHELNNTKGHAAGDKMLQTVANALHNFFDDGDVYRIGGDEFVVFVRDTDEKTTIKQFEDISAELNKCGYNISIGIRHQNIPIDIDTLIKQAEDIMREEKRAYYSQIGIEGRVRT